MGNRPQRTRLAVEALEERFLLAGNVMAAIKGGELQVRGDARNNQVQVTQLGGGALRVQGLMGTTVNGQAFFDTARPVKDVAIQMRQGGKDQFEVQGTFNLRGKLQVRLGAGEVLIEGSTGPVTIGKDLRVRTGANSDVTLRNEVHVRGKTTIDSGGTVNVVAGQATLPHFASAKFSNSLKFTNPYFPLEPGTTSTYEVVEAAGKVTEVIIVDVLPDTRTIQGIATRVVRDRVFREGRLIEDTFDWYAQDDTGNVWYFGEDVTNFEYDAQGNLIGSNKGGSWEAGVAGGNAGIIMEANPRVGDRYYQEFSPGTVLDQGTVLATGETANVPKGAFANVLRTKDTTVMEPAGLANKRYAPRLGLIQEFSFDHLTGAVDQTVGLVSLKLNGQEVNQIVQPPGFTGTNVSGKVIGGVQLDGAVTIKAGAEVAVIQATFGGKTAITSKSDVSVADSVLTGKAKIAAKGTVGLRNLTAQKNVQIEGNGDVHILDSRLGADTKITLGKGDSTLAVARSTLGRLEADGGAGQNTFENSEGTVIGKLKLKRFA